MDKQLVPGYGYLFDWEIKFWLSLPAASLIAWHKFFARLESIIGRYDPSLDFVRNPVCDTGRDIEQEDREYVMELCGNRVPLGLDILDNTVKEDMRELSTDQPGPGIDKVAVLAPEEVLDTAILRHGQQSEALRTLEGGVVLCKTYSSGSYVPVPRDLDALYWLMLRQHEFVSDTDEAWVHAHRMAARVSHGSGSSHNQACWDKKRGRDWSVSNPFCDRVWRWFEACDEHVALPRYKEHKTGHMLEHNLHASANGKEYDRTHYDEQEHRSRGTRLAYQGPILPRRCFDRWIDWPDMCVFGDIKDAMRKWLMAELDKGVDVRRTHTLLAGHVLRPAANDSAVIQIPKSVWRLALQDSHPELHSMLTWLEDLVVKTPKYEEDTPQRAWRRITFRYSSGRQAMENLLSVQSIIKLRNYISAVENPPSLIFGGKPLEAIIEMCTSWRAFYATLDAVHSSIPSMELITCHESSA